MKFIINLKNYLPYLIFVVFSTNAFSQFALKTPILDKKYYDIVGLALRSKELRSVEDYERRARKIVLATARIFLTNGTEKLGKSDLKRIDDFWENYFSQYSNVLCEAYILGRKKTMCKQRIEYLRSVNQTMFVFLYGARTKHKIPNGTVDKIIHEYSSIHDVLIAELEIIRKEVEKEAPLRLNLIKYKNGKG